jgi:hypothetical protein
MEGASDMLKIVRRYPFGVVYVPEAQESMDNAATVPAGAPEPSAETCPRTSPTCGGKPEAVRFDWLCAAARQPGKAAQLALMLAWQAAQASSPAVKPARRALRRFGVSRDACYDGLRRLEAAGLVHVWRLPGRLPQVILVEPGTDQPLRLQ